MATDTYALILAIGPFAVAAGLFVAASLFSYKSFERLRVLHSQKWHELGSPAFFSTNNRARKDAAIWLSSPEAASLGDATLVGMARRARILAYASLAAMAAWGAIWIWSVH
jgi:hypothetical protein